MLIAEPEVTVFDIKDNAEFVFMGCDGIFDVLSNDDVYNIVKECRDCVVNSGESKSERNGNIFYQELSNSVCNNVIKKAMVCGSADNVTCVFVCFEYMYIKGSNGNGGEVNVNVNKVKGSADEGGGGIKKKKMINAKIKLRNNSQTINYRYNHEQNNYFFLNTPLPLIETNHKSKRKHKHTKSLPKNI